MVRKKATMGNFELRLSDVSASRALAWNGRKTMIMKILFTPEKLGAFDRFFFHSRMQTELSARRQAVKPPTEERKNL